MKNPNCFNRQKPIRSPVRIVFVSVLAFAAAAMALLAAVSTPTPESVSPEIR
jgi:hypothetical protein